MLKLFETVKVLHLEPTDVCQAACPSCAREIDPTFDKKQKHILDVEDIKKLVPLNVIKQLDKMFMCGNYGDPAAGSRNVLNIIDYFKQVNDSITLGMNTNGGLQPPDWWALLAKRLNGPKDYVVFSIDGLEDTNHIYRINVSWKQLIKNVQSFIHAGGQAQWDMLVYRHNEHQVEACEKLARDLGFTWFRAKVSKRVPTVDWLKQPLGWSRTAIDQGTVDCFRNKDQSLYLSAKGIWYPCCWLGLGQDSIENFDQIQANWNTVNCNSICKQTCSAVNNMSNFTSQWQREIKLC